MPTISYRTDDRIGVVTIDRPERRNALDHRALDELADALAAARADEVRALVLWGAADHFCAGADLTELEDLAFTRTLRTVLDELADLPVPTVAAIAGSCMGLGVQLSLACDLRLATPDAKFAVPVARLGLMVDHWTVQRLAMFAGASTARWMVMTAEPIAADRAHEVGFVHRLIEPDPSVGPGATALVAGVELGHRIAQLAPLTLAGTKLGLNLLESDGDLADPDGAYRAAFERAWASDDLVEGRTAFAERRPPVFRGE